jgi:hypothetical protein
MLLLLHLSQASLSFSRDLPLASYLCSFWRCTRLDWTGSGCDVPTGFREVCVLYQQTTERLYSHIPGSNSEEPSSNLALQAECTDWGLSGFCWSLQENSGIVPKLPLRPLHSKHFVTRCWHSNLCSWKCVWQLRSYQTEQVSLKGKTLEVGTSELCQDSNCLDWCSASFPSVPSGKFRASTLNYITLALFHCFGNSAPVITAIYILSYRLSLY